MSCVRASLCVESSEKRYKWHLVFFTFWQNEMSKMSITLLTSGIPLEPPVLRLT